MEGSGRLSFRVVVRVRDRARFMLLPPPGCVGPQRRIGTEAEAHLFDKDFPSLSQAEIYYKPRHVYTGGFRNNMFHGSGVYQYEDPDSGCTAGYFGVWESDKFVGGAPKTWLRNKMGVWQEGGEKFKFK